MLRSLCVVALVAVPLRADVLVVDPAGGPGGAALLQAAYAAAQPGDILLLRQGDYSSASPISLTGKGVVVLADAGHDVHLPTLWLDLVPVGQTIVVRGLHLGPPAIDVACLYLGSLGPVWVEDCTVQGAVAEPSTLGTITAQLSSPSVVVVRGDYQGGDGASSSPGLDATPGGHGLSLNGKWYAAFDVTATGGRGGDGTFDPFIKPHGGAGLICAGGLDAVLLGGVFTGGDEGDAVPATTHGGAGASFGFTGAFLRGGTFVPGGVTGAGSPGVPIDAPFAPVTTFTAPVRLLELSSPVREFGTAQLGITGVPGDLALLLLSADMTVVTKPGLQGALVVPATASTLTHIVGVVGATGTLNASFLLPALPAGTEGTTIFAQLVTSDAQGQVTLGGASTLTWISAAF